MLHSPAEVSQGPKARALLPEGAQADGVQAHGVWADSVRAKTLWGRAGRVARGARRTRAGAAAAAALAATGFLLMGCGAEGEVAPRGQEPASCSTLDEHLAGVYALLEEGKLSHLAALLGGSLTRMDQRDLVAAGVRIASALDPGTFAALDSVDLATPGTGALEELGASLLSWLATEGPGAPYPVAMEAARRVVATCDGAPLLGLARAVLADEAAARAVSGLAPLLGSDGVGRAVGGLRFDGAQGRPALRALARNLLVVAASPDLSADELVELLAVVVDVSTPPWSDVAAAIQGVLGPPTLRASVASLSRCYQRADPALAWVDVLVDLLSAPGAVGTALAAVPTSPPDWARARPALLPPSIAVPADALLAALEGDAPARRALAVVLDAALAPDGASGVLSDLAELLRAHVLGDVVAALHALATRSCSP